MEELFWLIIGLDISRDDFYKKLTFQVSSSYGPGRYDSNYEDKGIDYPEGFVRWTAKRNFEAILNLMNEGHINTELLISKVHDFDNAEHVYENLMTTKLLAYFSNIMAQNTKPFKK